MPVYLVHGFRWPREGFTGIRVHAILHNLEDCSVEYIQNENSRKEILTSFRKVFPEIMKELEGPGRKLDFIEQYNPDDIDGPNAVSQPYAFVGDKVVMIAAGPGMGTSGPATVQAGGAPPGTGGGSAGSASALAGQVEAPTSPPQKKSHAPTLPVSKSAPFNSPAETTALSVNVEEVIADGPGLTNKAWEALADLRDKIAEGEKIGWWVVYNGDPERSYDDDEDDEMGEEIEDVEGEEDVDIYQNQYQQQRPVTSRSAAARPRTAPSGSTVNNRPPAPTPTPHIATQQQQGLTALPVRTASSRTGGPPGRPDKGKQKGTIPEPAKVKETAKPQGFRRKFFGKRL
ncbi:uncharacterized protein Z518_06753 [Rhinocladiella mackenziei CBS 650.93]|uniref:Uncharacterized protein n=1 Tax=Rhinocladiella mackenziei CBS 650.93 TaxID=1442369 RepID=A0A0D2IIS9_9EURO|nr:uncharacterized protein Z518_06753 [Rhinocladiella mackenziei CBS 650.93]KIX03201.1 hypothetical protein Z518_06753 [Rhinocladiella mackenziei CBS 650.93]